MNTFLTTLLIAISLSMDAFSLSLVYGTLNIDKKNKIILSFIVGIYHFLMPLLGLSIGSFVAKYLVFNLKYLVSKRSSTIRKYHKFPYFWIKC